MDTKDIFTKTFQKKSIPKPPKTESIEPILETKKAVAAKALPAKKSEIRNPKPEITAPVRREVVAAFDSENIVRAIHKAKEENQRITVDVPMDIYRSMKVHLAHENVSIRDFVVRLIDVYLTKNEIR